MKYLVFSLFLLNTAASFACRCNQLPPLGDEQYGSYQDILEVRVISVMDTNGWKNHTVEVLKIYKGQVSSTKILVASPHNSCGTGLNVGSNYLLYGTVKSDRIGIGLCDRITCTKEDNKESTTESQEQNKAKKEIEFLENKLK